MQISCKKGDVSTLNWIQSTISILNTVQEQLTSKMKYIYQLKHISAHHTRQLILSIILTYNFIQNYFSLVSYPVYTFLTFMISYIIDDLVHLKEIHQSLQMQEIQDQLLRQYYQYDDQKQLEQKLQYTKIYNHTVNDNAQMPNFQQQLQEQTVEKSKFLISGVNQAHNMYINDSGQNSFIDPFQIQEINDFSQPPHMINIVNRDKVVRTKLQLLQSNQQNEYRDQYIYEASNRKKKIIVIKRKITQEDNKFKPVEYLQQPQFGGEEKSSCQDNLSQQLSIQHYGVEDQKVQFDDQAAIIKEIFLKQQNNNDCYSQNKITDQTNFETRKNQNFLKCKDKTKDFENSIKIKEIPEVELIQDLQSIKGYFRNQKIFKNQDKQNVRGKEVQKEQQIKQQITVVLSESEKDDSIISESCKNIQQQKNLSQNKCANNQKQTNDPNKNLEEEEIENISFEEKLFQLNQELEQNTRREFLMVQKEKAQSKQKRILEQLKKFKEKKSEIFEQGFSEEDISSSFDNFNENCFKILGNSYQFQTVFNQKLHSAAVNDILFLGPSHQLSISCNREAYLMSLPIQNSSSDIISDELPNLQEETLNQFANNIQKIDFGEEIICQMSFVDPKQLLIFVNNQNSLLIFKFNEKDQEIQLQQIISECQKFSIDSWQFLNGYDLIATDGQNELKFWKCDTNNRFEEQKEDINEIEIIKNSSIYTINHDLFGTSLYFFESKSILMQAGFKKINGFRILFEKESNSISHQILWSIDCSALGEITQMQMVEYNQFSHILLSVHNKNKLILWNIYHQTQLREFQVQPSKQITQVVYNPFIKSFIISIDDILQSEIIFLDIQLQPILFPKNFKIPIQEKCKICKISTSQQMNFLSIGFENGVIHVLRIQNQSF